MRQVIDTTKLSSLGRQLSVLVLAFASSLSLAQTSPGARAAVTAGGTMTYPGMPRETPMMFIKALSITETKKDDATFAYFYLNPDLSVGFQYNYRFNFDFNVRTGKGYGPVPDGYYLLTVATFIKSMVNAKDARVNPAETLQDRFVTSNRPTVVRVIGGVAKPEVSLRFDNPTQGSVTNTLYVEFKPLTCPVGQTCLAFKANGEVDVQNSRLIPLDKGFAQYMLSMPWVPAARVASGDTDPNSELTPDTAKLTQMGLRDFAQVVRIGRQKQYGSLAQAPTTPREYATSHHLALIDFNDPRLYRAGQRFMNEDIRQSIHSVLTNYSAKPQRLPETKATMRAAFCDVITQLNVNSNLTPDAAIMRRNMNGARVANCSNESEFLQLRRNVHVGRVNADDFTVASYNRPFKNVLMQNITAGRSHDEGASATMTWKIWSMITSPLQIFTAPVAIVAKDITSNIPFDWTHNVSTTNSRSHNESGIMSNQEYMDVTPIVVTANAYNVQSCLEVKMAPTGRDTLFNDQPGATNGFYICEKPVANAAVDEVFMHSVTRMSDTSSATAYDRQTQSLNLLIRGDADISAYFRTVRGALRPNSPGDALGGTQWPDWYSGSAARYFAHTTGASTNVISTPVVIGADAEVPSFLGKLIGYYEERFDH